MATADVPEPIAQFTRAADGSPTIVASGEIDMETAPALRTLLSELIDGGAGPVCVDMAQVSFIDSSGLGVFVGALKQARERGSSVTVRNLDGSARKVFEITGLAEIFETD